MSQQSVLLSWFHLNLKILLNFDTVSLTESLSRNPLQEVIRHTRIDVLVWTHSQYRVEIEVRVKSLIVSKSRRSVENEARDLAIYLLRYVRGERLEKIGEEFI